MSLLGFDASGRLALGQLPAPRHLVLTSVRGSYVVEGQSASFEVGEAWVMRATPAATWADSAKQVETWIPAIKQSETWIPE